MTTIFNQGTRFGYVEDAEDFDAAMAELREWCDDNEVKIEES